MALVGVIRNDGKRKTEKNGSDEVCYTFKRA